MLTIVDLMKENRMIEEKVKDILKKYRNLEQKKRLEKSKAFRK